MPLRVLLPGFADKVRKFTLQAEFIDNEEEIKTARGVQEEAGKDTQISSTVPLQLMRTRSKSQKPFETTPCNSSSGMGSPANFDCSSNKQIC